MADQKLREMVDAFSSGDVFNAKDEILDAYLAEIVDRDKNEGFLVGNQLRPEVVPAMAGIVLSIKQSRMVAAIEASNRKTTFWFRLLAIASLFVGCCQLLVALVEFVCRHSQ